MDGQKTITAGASVTCSVIEATPLERYLCEQADRHSQPPLVLQYEKTLSGCKLFFLFEVTVRGAPLKVEGMVQKLDAKLGRHRMCLHERLQAN